MDLPVIDIELKRGETGLGFNIVGGIDTPHLENDYGIFVAKIKDGGAAARDGRLHEGDKILSVNGTRLSNLTHSEAVSYFKDAGPTVRLKVQQGAERYARALRDGEVRTPRGRFGGGVSDQNMYLVAGVVGISLAIIFALYKFKVIGKKE